MRGEVLNVVLSEVLNVLLSEVHEKSISNLAVYSFIYKDILIFFHLYTEFDDLLVYVVTLFIE